LTCQVWSFEIISEPLQERWPQAINEKSKKKLKSKKKRRLHNLHHKKKSRRYLPAKWRLKAKSEEKKAIKNPWSLAVEGQVTPRQHGADSSSRSFYKSSVFFQPNKSHILEAHQPFFHIWQAEKDQDSFGLIDTEFNYLYFFVPPKDESYSLLIKSTYWAPISPDAIDNSSFGKAQLRLEFTNYFLDRKFELSYRPWLKYHFGEYSSNIDFKPLPLFSFGNELFFNYTFNSRFSTELSLNAGFDFLQRIGPQEIFNSDGSSSLQDSEEFSGFFGFGIKAKYKLTAKINIHIGYALNDSILKEGGYQVKFIDDSKSVFFSGLKWVIF